MNWIMLIRKHTRSLLPVWDGRQRAQPISPSNGQTIQAADIVLSFGSLVGCVKDDLGNPVSNVSVSGSFTDADGNYIISNLTPGFHAITASKVGYVSSSQVLIVAGAQTRTCNFTLTRTGTVMGMVKDNLGRPIAYIGVYIGANVIGTDSNGAYTLSEINPGIYSMIAQDTGWTRVTKDNIVVVPGGTVTVDFTMQLGTITGTVKDRLGNPVSYATVAFTYGGSSSTTTNAAGEYTFVNVWPACNGMDNAPYHYKLTASQAGYLSEEKPLEVIGDKITSRDFTITQCGSISGNVTGADGQPLGGVSIKINCTIYSAISDFLGQYSMSNVPPASSFDLIATKTGYATVLKKITISDGQETACNFHVGDAVALELVSITGIGNIYDSANDVAVANGIAAVSSTPGLQFFDVSNPLNPIKLCTFGKAWDVEINGHYAYVANRSPALSILDIANPSTPTLLGTFSGYAKAIDVVGDFAYITTSSGLKIINISNPANPILTGDFVTSGSLWSVDVAGGYAYVANGTGLTIINVQNPAAPFVAGSFTIPNSSIIDVAVSGNFAYLPDEYFRQFLVIDVSAPSAPKLVGTGFVPTNVRPEKIDISGNYAFVGAYNDGGIIVYDISVPTDPGFVAQYQQCAATEFAFSDGYIYAADITGFLKIFTTNSTKITGMWPPQAANNVSSLNAGLSGQCFKQGSSVKLTRAGCADIYATEVLVTDAAHIMCKLNLDGVATGLWNVIVTSPEGLSSCLLSGFAVVLPDNTPCVASTNRSITDPIIAAACSKWQFKLFGKVTKTTTGFFWISDGSGLSVKVYAPGYSSTRIATGKYVAVTGTLDLSSGTAVLVSRDAKIDILQ